jgi:hypothetical protein
MKCYMGKSVNNQILAGIVTLFFGLAPVALVSADDQAPAFSNPDELAPVDEDWASRTVEYEKELRDSDLVIALGQQSHPIFKDLIPEYAKKKNITTGVRTGTCATAFSRWSTPRKSIAGCLA